eukprot:7276795-Prymnesium_polylepis.1
MAIKLEPAVLGVVAKGEIRESREGITLHLVRCGLVHHTVREHRMQEPVVIVSRAHERGGQVRVGVAEGASVADPV